MLTTEHRPAPLPDRGTAAASKRPALPEGAVKMSRTWLDRNGRPRSTAYPVPVDDLDRRTPHLRYVCRGRVEVITTSPADGTSTRTVEPCPQVGWVKPGDKVTFCPEHGAKLVLDDVDKAGAIPIKAMWRAVDAPARPLWLLAAEIAAGIAVHQAEVPAVAVLAATPVMAAAAHRATWRYLARRAAQAVPPKPVEGRRAATYRRRARTAAWTGGVAGGWLTVVAAVEPSGNLGVAVWCTAPALLAAAAPWWRYLSALRNRTAPAETPADTPAELNPAAVRDADDWATTVAAAPAGAGGLPGTAVDLATWEADEGGRRMVIRNTARRAALTDARLRQALPVIAGAFDVPRSAIGWVEEYDGSPRSCTWAAASTART
jgi:hypothetical protein